MGSDGLAVRDPGQLDLEIDGQVQHVSGGPGLGGQPAQGQTLVASSQPEVEHDADSQPKRTQRQQWV